MRIQDGSYCTCQMVVNGFRYGQCVRFGADVLEVQFFERQNAQAIWEGPLPYCHRVLSGANATARMRRVEHELCLSRAGSDNKRLLDAATGMVCCTLLLNTANAPGLHPEKNTTPHSGMHLDVRHRTFRP
jgi:hypothetical protein